MSLEEVPPEKRKSNDLKCQVCGTFNIPENRICGRCGANLPIIYDEEGRIFNWRQSPYFERLVGGSTQRKPRVNSYRAAWFLRGVALLIAFYAAYRILHHHR